MTQVTGPLFDEVGNLLANTTCVVQAQEALLGQDGGGRAKRGVEVTTSGAGIFDADIKPGAHILTVWVQAPGASSVTALVRGKLIVLDQANQSLQSALDSDVGDITPSALQQAVAAKDAAEAAAILAQSAYQGRQYTTRAAFVADVAAGYDPAAGTVVTASGVQYVRSAGATSLPGLPGWLPVKVNGRYPVAAWAEDLGSAAAFSGLLLGTPGVTYSIGTTLVFNGVSMDMDFSQSIIDRSSGTATAIQHLGRWLHAQAPSAISGNVWTVANGSLFSVGDVVKVYQDIALEFDENGLEGEFTTVVEISGNDLTLDTLFHTYAVADGAEIAKLDTSIRSRLRLGALTSSGGGSPALYLDAQSLSDPDWHVSKLVYANSGKGIEPASCYGGTFTIGNAEGSAGSGFRYGIVWSGCHGTHSSVRTATRLRHALDGGAGGVNKHAKPARYGASVYCVGRDSISIGSTQTDFATHHGCRECEMRDVTAIGGTSGAAAFRGLNNRGVRVRAVRKPSNAFSAFIQSGRTASQTRGTKFIDCEIVDGRSQFFNSSNDGVDIQVIGGSGTLGTGFAGTIPRLFENRGELHLDGFRATIERNVSNRYFNNRTGATALTLRDVVLSITSPTAPSSIIDNSASADLLLNIDGLRIENPNQTIANIYSNTALLETGSKIGNIAVTHGLTNIINGVSDLSPYLTGPVIANGQYRAVPGGFPFKGPFADDAAAGAAGVVVGELYRVTGGGTAWRVS